LFFDSNFLYQIPTRKGARDNPHPLRGTGIATVYEKNISGTLDMSNPFPCEKNAEDSPPAMPPTPNDLKKRCNSSPSTQCDSKDENEHGKAELWTESLTPGRKAEYLTVMADQGASLGFDALKLGEQARKDEECGDLEASMRVRQ